MVKHVTVEFSSKELGNFRWKLPPHVPSGQVSEVDAEVIAEALKPHVEWILSTLVACLKMGQRGKDLFLLLRRTEKNHDAESLKVILS